jgi:hypothetical protein
MRSLASGQIQGVSRSCGGPWRSFAGYLWRLPASAALYVVGAAGAGAVALALGVKMPEVPEGLDEQQIGQSTFLVALLASLALALLARCQRGMYVVRWLVLAVFTYVSLGINTALEASIFTRLGNMSSMAWLFLPPTVLCAGAVALLFGSSGEAEPFRVSLSRFFAARRPADWTWRLALALAAFPVIYWVFGALLMAIAPWALDYYLDHSGPLILPPPMLIVAVVLLRSLLFLLSALPLVVTWAGSRRALMVRLGCAYWVLVGLFGLIQASWLPLGLRVGHSLEILADSLVYAWALVVLLVPVEEKRARAVDSGRCLKAGCS